MKLERRTHNFLLQAFEARFFVFLYNGKLTHASNEDVMSAILQSLISKFSDLSTDGMIGKFRDSVEEVWEFSFDAFQIGALVSVSARCPDSFAISTRPASLYAFMSTFW